jgi:CHAT domain-containing protein
VYVKFLQKPAANKLPHITWCLAGYLTFLPIHAAGLYGAKDQPKIFDYVVSSYTPTLGALLSAMHRPASGVGTRLLAVSQPATSHQKPLPGTVHEVDAIQTIHYTTGRLPFTRLNDQEATVTAVLQSMKECNWVHLACHGVQDDDNVIESAFLLFDGQLTLKEIMRQSFSHAELAILSACQSAKGDSALPEEAIHLAGGMLMAGYRGVVGTMWSIRDDDAPIITEKFYTYLIVEAGGDSTKAAYALHKAVGHLRDSSDGHDFARWVPFIHLGICSMSGPSASA